MSSVFHWLKHRCHGNLSREALWKTDQHPSCFQPIDHLQWPDFPQKKHRYFVCSITRVWFQCFIDRNTDACEFVEGGANKDRTDSRLFSAVELFVSTGLPLEEDGIETLSISLLEYEFSISSIETPVSWESITSSSMVDRSESKLFLAGLSALTGLSWETSSLVLHRLKHRNPFSLRRPFLHDASIFFL